MVATSTTIPPALLIAEVFRNICSFSYRATVLSLAQCCKTFHTPAIEALWYNLFDLAPLITCFPRDAVSRVPGSGLREYYLLRPLRAEDYTTFLKYAPYVKIFGLSNSYQPGVSQLSLGLLQAICALRPTLVLLPNVRELNTSTMGIADACLPYLLSIVGKELVTVNILIHGDDELDPGGTAAAVAALLTTQPNLRAVSYTERGNPSSAPSRFSTLLRIAPPLTTFQCNAVAVSPEDVFALSRLATLRTIHIRLVNSTEQWPLIPADAQPFCGASTFSVTSTASSYRPFVEAYKLPQIRKFSLHLTSRPQPHELSTLIASIRKQFDPTVLTSLEVEDSGTPTAADGEIAADLGVYLFPAHIRPLLDFKELRKFTFMPAWGYRLNNGLYLDMAKAWPHIEDLRFAHMFWCHHEPPLEVTMEVLSYFAVHCPDLTALAIQFNASAWATLPESKIGFGDYKVPPSFYSGLEGGLSRSKVELLWVERDRCPIQYAPAVALYLMRLFPRLTFLWCDYPDPDGAPDMMWGVLWDEIERFMPVMAEMRNIGVSTVKAAGTERTLVTAP